jgi:hypothetical protein
MQSIFGNNTSVIAYSMIGLTTVVLAALTVFQSSTEPESDKSFVSELLQTNNEVDKNASLISGLSGGNKKTRKNHKKNNRKTKHRK